MLFNRHADYEKVMLLSVRFRKLLEEARGLMDLFEDAEEKINEEYIFDRQYILSLIDKVLDRAKRLVFHAHVLAPKGSEALYELFDRSKRFAEETFILPPANTWASVKPVSDSEELKEPETQMLLDVLQWLQKPKTEDEFTMLDLIKQVFDHVADAIQSPSGVVKIASSVNFACKDVQNRIELVALEQDDDNEKAGPFHCKPLELMTFGKTNPSALSEASTRQWIGWANEDQLNLQKAENGSMLLVEASLMGYDDSDFLFLYSQGHEDLSGLLPKGFRVEKTGKGQLAWRYDASGSELEQNLMDLGQSLFG